MNAIWAWTDETTGAIDDLISTIAGIGFDTLIYYCGSALARYESSYLPWHGSVSGGYEPMAYVIEQGHAAGLSVHTWWSVGPTIQNATFRGWHPTWTIELILNESYHWLNFSMSAVRDFVADVALEMASYGQDAVHLDYIRYPSPPPFSPVDCRGTFSHTDVSTAVEGAYDDLKASYPGTHLSAAVMAGLTADLNALQYWHNWLTGEYVDVVFPMAYFEAGSEYLGDCIDEWQAKDHPERIHPGLSFEYDGVPKTPAELLDQMDECRGEGFSNFSFFSYGDMTEDLADMLSGEFQSEYVAGTPAVSGPVTWTAPSSPSSYHSG